MLHVEHFLGLDQARPNENGSHLARCFKSSNFCRFFRSRFRNW